jgi:hypothetical protein
MFLWDDTNMLTSGTIETFVSWDKLPFMYTKNVMIWFILILMSIVKYGSDPFDIVKLHSALMSIQESRWMRVYKSLDEWDNFVISASHQWCFNSRSWPDGIYST